MIKRIILIIAAVMMIAPSGYAAIFGYVNNPESNSIDWGSAVTGLGGTINSNVDFDSHPTGVLQSDFYSLGDGVTLTPSGDVNNVVFGQGPGQGNTGSTPLSTGEGLHPRSNYLFDAGNISSLTVSFANPVLGAGLFVIDYFNPSGSSNYLTLEAYSGANATGALLGSFNSANYNFQMNYMYFMGISSTESNIGSIRFIDTTSETGDTTGIDNILFASGNGAPVVPEPATLSLLGLGLAGLAARTRKKKI